VERMLAKLSCRRYPAGLEGSVASGRRVACRSRC
jgi:hypothetical protein